MPRLLTYNVHRCVGIDRRLDVGRIAAVIAEHEPDVVCLQELDVGRARTGLVDQAGAIADRLGEGWLGHPSCVGPTILTGDFNATSITRPYMALTRRLSDCQRALGLRPSVKTFPSSFPAIRIDHCFTSPEIVVTGVTAPFSPLARMASDHLPLVVDFEFRT